MEAQYNCIYIKFIQDYIEIYLFKYETLITKINEFDKQLILFMEFIFRAPGASLVLIRGHRHLHECAYIGDDSSEELNELLEIANETVLENLKKTDDNAPSNRRKLFLQVSRDIEFHDTELKNSNDTIIGQRSVHLKSDEKMNTKDMENLLNTLKLKRTKKTHYKTFDNIHKHRDADVGEKEKKNFQFKDPNLEREVMR